MQKLLILPLLLGGQPLNSVFHFTIDRMIIHSTSVTFLPEHVLKHSKLGRKLDVNIELIQILIFVFYLECLKEYIHRRNNRVDKEQKRLFITYRKPYHTAPIDSLRRWIKETFSQTNAFKVSLNIMDILRKAY